MKQFKIIQYRDKRVISLRLQVGDRSLAVFCVCGPNSSTEYLAIMESLGGVLDSALTGHPIVLLADFIAQVGNDRDAWEGWPPRPEPGGICYWTYVFVIICP